MFLLSLSKPASVCEQGRVIDGHYAVDAPDGAVPTAVVTEGNEDVVDDGRKKK